MEAPKLADALWLRTDVAWPNNDRPEESHLARIFNLIYSRLMENKTKFWEDHEAKKSQGYFLTYADFNDTEPETSYFKANELEAGMEEGLLLWDKTRTVRFSEDITSFFGVGLEESRKLTPIKGEMPDLPQVTFGEEIAKIKNAYNKARRDTIPEK